MRQMNYWYLFSDSDLSMTLTFLSLICCLHYFQINFSRHSYQTLFTGTIWKKIKNIPSFITFNSDLWEWLKVRILLFFNPDVPQAKA